MKQLFLNLKLNKKADTCVSTFWGTVQRGEAGIRTLGRLSSTTVFKTVPLNRSGTSPFQNKDNIRLKANQPLKTKSPEQLFVVGSLF